MELNFHHIGIVVKSIQEYESNMLFEQKVAVVYDETQLAKLALYKNFSNSYLELIEPLEESSPSYNSLSKFGNHLNHICYEFRGTMKELEKFINEKKWIKVMGPVPAKLFKNKSVVFYITRNRQLIEFIMI